ACPLRAERPERRVVLRRVEHDLAALVRHCRPSVREPAHVVVLGRLEPTGAERAAGLGQVGPVLARADDERSETGVVVGAELGAGRGAHAVPPSAWWRTAAISTCSVCSSIAARASGARPVSETNTSISSSPAMRLNPRTFHFVWSATTIRFDEADTKTRSVS